VLKKKRKEFSATKKMPNQEKNFTQCFGTLLENFGTFLLTVLHPSPGVVRSGRPSMVRFPFTKKGKEWNLFAIFCPFWWLPGGIVCASPNSGM
jgi:hypothetical protein